MRVFTHSTRGIYDSLPEHYRGEIHVVFEEKTGKALKAYISGDSIMTPRQIELFASIVGEYHTTYLTEIQDKEERKLAKTVRSTKKATKV